MDAHHRSANTLTLLRMELVACGTPRKSSHPWAHSSVSQNTSKTSRRPRWRTSPVSLTCLSWVHQSILEKGLFHWSCNVSMDRQNRFSFRECFAVLTGHRAAAPFSELLASWICKATLNFSLQTTVSKIIATAKSRGNAAAFNIFPSSPPQPQTA